MINHVSTFYEIQIRHCWLIMMVSNKEVHFLSLRQIHCVIAMRFHFTLVIARVSTQNTTTVEDQMTNTHETETVLVTYYEQCQLALCCRVSLELLQLQTL